MSPRQIQGAFGKRNPPDKRPVEPTTVKSESFTPSYSNISIALTAYWSLLLGGFFLFYLFRSNVWLIPTHNAEFVFWPMILILLVAGVLISWRWWDAINHYFDNKPEPWFFKSDRRMDSLMMRFIQAPLLFGVTGMVVYLLGMSMMASFSIGVEKEITFHVTLRAKAYRKCAGYRTSPTKEYGNAVLCRIPQKIFSTIKAGGIVTLLGVETPIGFRATKIVQYSGSKPSS